MVITKLPTTGILAFVLTGNKLSAQDKKKNTFPSIERKESE
jgi:hypothetical protein